MYIIRNKINIIILHKKIGRNIFLNENVSKTLKHNFFSLIFLIYFEIPVHEDA